MHIFPSVHTLFILRPFPKINQSTNLLLSDVLMPELDGPDLAEQLRAVRPDVRVIFMSAEWVPDGVCPFVQKPLLLVALMHHS
jgi:CheY-like chemotaxis protein